MGYVVEGFRLDPELFELTCDGAPVALEPQAFDVLVHLVRERDRVVSKEELMDSIWGGRFVTEAAVTSRIKQVRRALGDDGTAQRLVRTVHGRGYRFVGPVEVDQEPSPPAAPAAPAVAGVADDGAAAVPAAEDPAPAPGRDNLVTPLNPLVGRQDELLHVAAALDRARLVTVLGTGGIGKTRLALEVARLRADPDGPWFVELAGLADGGLLAETVATVLGIPSAVDTTALAAVVRQRQFLLVLDNGEHLAAALAPFVTDLLQRCPGLRVLVTSRQVLGVPGELVLDLPPLTPADAEQLFLSRAELAVPSWTPDPEERGLVQQVCHRLDHLPLALELAAAQCRALSLDQLASELGDRFALLGGGPTEQRHASLAAAVAWSYDSLSEPERELFEALCLFEGSFAFDGVRAVTAAPSAPTDLLLALVNKSLVTVLPGSPRRYRILETLRQFAGPRRPADRTRDVQQRLVRWVSSLAEEAEVELDGPRSREWMERIDHYKETIRAALGWMGDDQGARLRTAVGILWFWYRRGHTAEALRALEPLSLTPAVASDDASGGAPQVVPVPGVPSAVLLRGAVGVVLLRYLAGDLALLPAALEQARARLEATADAASQSYALSTLAYFGAATGQVEAAFADARTALEIAERLGSDRLLSNGFLSLAFTHLRAGAAAEAERCAVRGVTHADACGYGWGAVAALWTASKARIAAGDFSASTVAGLVRVVLDSAANRDVTSWLVGLVSTGYVLVERGDGELAAELLGIADRQGQLIGFAPEAMDPVDTGRYLRQAMSVVRDAGLVPRYEEGRRLPTDQARARVAELFQPAADPAAVHA